jgi:hypothetical protein
MKRRTDLFRSLQRACPHRLEIPRPDEGWAILDERLQIAADRIAPARHVTWSPADLPDRIVVAFRDRADLLRFEAWLAEKRVLAEPGGPEMYEATVEIPSALADDAKCLEQLHAIAHAITLGRYLMARAGPDTVFGFAALSDSKTFRRRLEQLRQQTGAAAHI